MQSPPSTIGRYRILGELGQGAMGVVYLAEDPVLKRGVAIKLVHGGTAAQSEALMRFQREAEISAQLNHPNIITVFDVGEEPGLGPFLAMEFIDGRSLEDHLREGPMEAETAVMVLVQALLALEAAHGAGIIHRDFKPANLMVDSKGRLKLMDFGIARREDQNLTTSGLFCTPAYAAPELLAGEPPSEATDHWAFFVCAFHCLTGHLPFGGETLSRMLFTVAHGPPDLPLDFPKDLGQFFIRALAKDPKLRPPSLRVFMAELLPLLPISTETYQQVQAMMRDRPLGSTSQQPPSSQRPQKTSKAFPWHWMGLGAGIFLLLIASGLWWFFQVSKRIHAPAPTASQAPTIPPPTEPVSCPPMDIISTPPEVKVFAEDQFLGLTPLKGIQVPSKARILRFEKPGYQPYLRSIRPGEREIRVNLSKTRK